jgi:hypothetical protein
MVLAETISDQSEGETKLFELYDWLAHAQTDVTLDFVESDNGLISQRRNEGNCPTSQKRHSKRNTVQIRTHGQFTLKDAVDAFIAKSRPAVRKRTPKAVSKSISCPFSTSIRGAALQQIFRV